MAKKLLTKSEVIADISTKINDEVEQGITGEKLAGVLTNMVNYSEDASQTLLSSGSAEHSLQMAGEVTIVDGNDVVNTYVNDSISMMSVTLGIGNSAGIGGWKYNAIRVGEENVDFYLTTNTNIDTISINPEEEPIDNTLLSGFAKDDKLSLIIKGVSYNDVFTIKYINNSETVVNGNKISVSREEFDAVFGNADLETLFNSSGINSSINYSLFCLAKPFNVNYNSDIGQAAFAAGIMNNANNLASNASGYKTNAYGMFSTTEGRETKAGYAAHAEGCETVASGDHSHAEGFMTNASGLASHTEGRQTIATNEYEHSEGKYNLSIKDKTIHTVGIGYTTYSPDIQDDIVSRINAEEIHSNGDKYVYGIGGYDGTNSQTAGIKTVQEVVKEGTNAVQITYAELKSLRDAGKLVLGTQYRITDYTCTTTQIGTKSAGHQFDIIVTADDENTLNEVARAVKHNGDTYFANSDLNAWKIWYCLDNDTARFAWADATNGKGIIYRMIDEWNNDVPYDFKNIQFYRRWDSRTSLWSIISTDNTGVPCYTFSSNGNSSTTSFTDMSLHTSNIVNSVYFNVIKEHIISNNIQTLNNNCFFGNHIGYNFFEVNCYDNTLKDCDNNFFGNGCSNNTLITSSCYNTFGYNCSNNSFRYDCRHNSFGNNCYSNSFGNYCYSNTFGNDCGSNIFGDRCSRNTFGNDCYCINFAADSSASIKYDYYRYNHLGDGCQYIVFAGAETASYSQQVQNYNFAQGLQGTSSAYLTIDGKRNLPYETYVSKDTDGTIKESVIEEFENKLGNCVDLTSEQTITAAKTFSAGISMNNTRIRKVKAPTANDDAANKKYVDDSVIAKPDIFILSSDRTMNEAVDAINKKMFIVIKSPRQIFEDYGYLFADYACVWSDGTPKFLFHYIDNRGVYELQYYYDGMDDRWEISQREYTIPDYNHLVLLSGKQTITGKKTFSAGIDLNGTIISKVGSPVNTDDAANKKYVDDFAATKQDVLTAGKGIVIDDNNTISINVDPDIFKVVSVLPEVPAEGDEKKIHLVPADYSESGNAYDEYIYVDGSWEKIGSFRPTIDLSEYAEKSYVDSKVASLEAKNTELTNTITTLETKISELEIIISQITIKEE